MTADSASAASTAPASSSSAPSPAAGPRAAAPSATAPSWPWRRGAMLLAGAAQLITISALLSVDPVAVTWASLLLAIAPAPILAVVVFGPGAARRPAAVAGLAVLIAGIAGQVTHTGLFFLPALVVLAVGTVMLWREPA